MELIKGIKERRSTRKFTDQAVSEEEIRAIVSAAAYAPSWKNTQTAHYIAINQAKKQEIADTCVMGFAGNQRIIGQAPVLIVETTVNERSGYERDGSFSTSKGTHWQSYDAGLAGEAFCLAAWEKGLGTVIMGIFEEAKVKEALQIPDRIGIRTDRTRLSGRSAGGSEEKRNRTTVEDCKIKRTSILSEKQLTNRKSML